jgi:uncharacterized protein YndB with AHSA1/START domain
MTYEPLAFEFRVAAPAAQAFDAWTQQCAKWWPRSHTISGAPSAIVFEPRQGGRIIERARDGTEHVWGEVLEWKPPTRLRYLWHLFFDPSEATEIEVTFSQAQAHTMVRLEQRGWERLGPVGEERRGRTCAAWKAITADFQRHVQSTR